MLSFGGESVTSFWDGHESDRVQEGKKTYFGGNIFISLFTFAHERPPESPPPRLQQDALCDETSLPVWFPV